MSSEEWFQHFERLEAEHPEMSDEELDAAARDAQVDEWAARADMLHDEVNRG